MDTAIIANVARRTLDGTIPFPEVVGQLIGTGVESYHVDYVRLQKAFYDGAGAVVVVPIDYPGLPPIGESFDAEELRAAIRDSQRHGQTYRDFTRRAMAAGVQGYLAFLRGKRITYWGRAGDQHTEWFPGAAPAHLVAASP